MKVMALALKKRVGQPKAASEGLHEILRWIACAMMVVAIFALSGHFLPKLLVHIDYDHTEYVAWVVTFGASIPFMDYDFPPALPQAPSLGDRVEGCL